MNRFRKITIGILVSLQLGIAGLIPLSNRVANKNNEEVERYVKNNITQIMSEQERILGIKHFGIPKIRFNYREDSDIGERLQTSGEYDEIKDTVIIPPNGLNVSPDQKLSLLEKLLTFGHQVNVKKVLDHELGHYYTDKLSESLGNGNLSIPYGSTEDTIRHKLIFEGIAEYFNKTINNGKDNFVDSDWEKKAKKFTYIVYGGGYHLVKPIIDKHGAEGIKYLITHIPRREDLKYMQDYQNKALKALEK